MRIIKHHHPGHTFHPKLYLFEWDDHATIIIGSNNITEGGFFGNYEGAARVTYELPKENDACNKLGRFLQPDGPVSYQLTEQLLKEFTNRGEVPTEIEAREGRDFVKRIKKSAVEKGETIFGTEDIAPPPPLPADILERLIKAVRARRRIAKKASSTETTTIVPIDEQSSDSLLPAAFYMTLPTLQGDILLLYNFFIEEARVTV